MKMSEVIKTRRTLILVMLVIMSSRVLAGAGVPDYSQTAQALAEMNVWVMNIGGAVVSLLYAVGAVLAIYSATTIYLKMQNGEDGFTKSVLMLVGSILFLISAVRVLPAFFGLGAGVGLW